MEPINPQGIPPFPLTYAFHGYRLLILSVTQSGAQAAAQSLRHQALLALLTLDTIMSAVVSRL